MIDVPVLVDAARFVLGRVTVSPTELREQLLVDRETADQLLNHLQRWGLVSRQVNRWPRMVLVLPAHEAVVTGAISLHQGIPPLHNPILAHTHPGLTDRCREILDLLAEGCDNVDIGARLDLSPRTVKGHLVACCRRFQARNRLHLVTVAHQRGLLPNPHKTSTVGTGGAP